MKYYKLLSIIDRGRSTPLMAAVRKVGAPGGTILYGRGTASNSILAMLGIGDRRREILVNIIPAEAKETILSEVEKMRLKGVLILMDCEGDEDEEDVMESDWEMIEVICADGLSEDIMVAARKAGAKGGTVISGRGTCTEADLKFFGAPLVPEKEVLMIVCDKKRAKGIKDAISSLQVLKKKGVGIMFSVPVRDFRNLG